MPGKDTLTAVSRSAGEAVYEVDGVTVADLLEELVRGSVQVDEVLHFGPHTVFSAPLASRPATAAALDRLEATWSERDHLAKVSVRDVGVRSYGAAVSRTFATLRSLRVEPQFVSASPSAIAFYVPDEDSQRIVVALRQALGAEEAVRA